MNPSSATIPFVDLSIQHQPLKTQFDEAMLAVLRQGDFILGQAVKDFEVAFAQKSGVQYGIGVACGTDAIALGLKACGIQPGDEIILPANTFIATLIGVLHSGATPILANCDPNSALIDLQAAEKLVTPKTKAILPVHLYGQMVSPRAILDFAQNHNLFIFEDAAQAHLAHREGYTAGSVGKAAAYSFYPSKNLGAFGDGGMVLTNDPEVDSNMKTLRNYGAPRKYYHTELGTNSRLDTLQAAILNVKLPHLLTWNQQRNQAAQEYDRLFAPLAASGIVPISNFSGTGHVYHLYVIRLLESCPLSRDTLQEKLKLANIQTGIHYPVPCHLQPAYAHLGYHAEDFPEAEQLCESILSLPMFPGITLEQIERVVEAIALAVKNN
ncbi:DegT/DnrJ/EryC1/StrS family aminotransferase [Roseofilum reptotaenium CS-1145]|uniref:Erythromycin biosynthesis sensory transduction protein eryC1 n=1 Tax=Roseofilum reptotaenium AO1-A TaxID=1925591 RepID=A0A1L9QNM1_9CYAN|nr:DegT/DnrJ/EryC1/StrS family aminotransferase [Roseofilum reptotaenium]MDB9517600.1 DegT/DnrJ/EryC1/StrS family aminotransferase [Roseofilum reptotaenium CS-1145]OJJ24288.1 erythromycin biosynthesis sensory transduction protein eryC1 [Roseofilum reptotaenium AO1-A]